MQNTGSFCLLSPTLLIHCLTLPLAGLLQVAQAELQKTCAKSTVENLPSGCQQLCQCRPPPLLPPPPPPPPPPRLPPPKLPQCCVEETWWHFLLIILAAIVLFIVVIMCYKAIKSVRFMAYMMQRKAASENLGANLKYSTLYRKPLHKDENGTTRAAEYAMNLETA